MSIAKQKEYYSKVMDNAGNDQKMLYKVVNEVLDKKKIRSLPEHEDPTHLANEFNEYYIDKIVKLRKTLPEDDVKLNIEVKLFEDEKLLSFKPTNEEEITGILKEFGVKTSVEDPIPASILKLIINEAVPTLTMLVNDSLRTGSMDGIKLSILDPLLKKSGLDTESKKNYRPVNNLLFMSKLIERVVLSRLNTHMTCHNLHCDSNFGYKKFHSTETMMLGLVDEVLSGFDENKCTIILFLDLSAAFDTIDHEKLLKILSEEIGIGGVALQWFRSFLIGRTQKVKIGNVFSKICEVLFGAPQGSVLGPKLFSIYVRSQPEIFKLCFFKSSSFADDSNGRKTFSLTFQYNILKNEVANCMEKITIWMNKQFLKINPDKTELLLLYPPELKEKVIIQGIILNDQCIRFSNQVKNVGLWLDKNLNFDYHVNKIVSYSFKHLKDIGRIRSLLSRKHTEMLVHAVITSMDYCNSVLFDINKSNLHKFQKVQNAAARLVVQKRKHESISDSIKELHWLRVESRIIFKLLLLTHKSIQGRCSKNLQLPYKMFNCRPDDYLMLQTKRCKTKYGERTFSWAAPRLWNALPLEIRVQENTDLFKKLVKTLLFDDTGGFRKKAFRYT